MLKVKKMNVEGQMMTLEISGKVFKLAGGVLVWIY